MDEMTRTINEIRDRMTELIADKRRLETQVEQADATIRELRSDRDCWRGRVEMNGGNG